MSQDPRAIDKFIKASLNTPAISILIEIDEIKWAKIICAHIADNMWEYDYDLKMDDVIEEMVKVHTDQGK